MSGVQATPTLFIHGGATHGALTPTELRQSIADAPNDRHEPRRRRAAVPRFIIEPHFRLPEWVAEEKGYFHREGLDYEFREFIRSTDGAHHHTVGKVGAFQSIEQGRVSNVTCACHWTVNVAASRGHTKLFADAYSVAPSAVFVPAGSDVRTPEDLAGVPISVGYQSGSHYATIQALEPYLPADRIYLSFAEGMLFGRMEAFLDGGTPACTLFGGPYYFASSSASARSSTPPS